VLEIGLTEEGKKDPLFKGTAEKQQCLQWHSVRVAQAPEGAIILANSDVCSIQAMRIGKNAWSMQYHVEIESDTVDNWGAIPEYAEALRNTLGQGALSELKQKTDQNMSQCLSCAKQIYDNFMGQIV
jgi:GMP synthase-like glutamine amidotransferase